MPKFEMAQRPGINISDNTGTVATGINYTKDFSYTTEKPEITYADGGSTASGISTTITETITEATTVAPAEYINATDYDDVAISIVWRKSDLSTVLYNRVNKPICLKNIVGEDGMFKIKVQYIKKSSTWTDGETATISVTRVEKEDEYNLEQWIEKSIGKKLKTINAITAWANLSPEDSIVKEDGFGIEFERGSENGTNKAGRLRITFKISAQVKGTDQYVIASSSVIISVKAGWYTDNLGTSIELKPIAALCDVYASLDDDETFVKVASVGDYLLVLSTVSGNPTTANATRSNGIAGTEAVTKVNIRNDELHFLIDSTEIFGVLRNVRDGYSNNVDTKTVGEVVLFQDYLPPVTGESNIEVTYPCYVYGNADKINKCRIAKLFGNANAKNRLFVSGNQDFGNCDWHTSEINNYLGDKTPAELNGDFTYFGDMDYCFYGQTDNEIMGYDHVATDKMVVLKSKSKIEPTNYFRTSTLIQAIDASGNAVYGIDGNAVYSESFPLATGNIGLGAMNINSIANLNGDTLYISSENTVCGLDISGQVGDSQRVSYSRSKFIDEELRKLDLSDAVLWTDNTELYLFASEATYMTNYRTMDGESSQYEWFKIDVKGIRCAIEIDGVMFFGTKNGSLYRFESGVYEDCDKVFVQAGGALYVTMDDLFEHDKIVYSSDLNGSIDEDAKYSFVLHPYYLMGEFYPQRSVFRRVATVSNVAGANVDLLVNAEANALRIVALDSNGDYDCDRHMELLDELASSEYRFYANQSGSNETLSKVGSGTDIDYYKPYHLVPTDDLADEYKVYDQDQTEMDVTEIALIDLCRILDGEYEVYNLDKEDCTFQLKEHGRPIDVVKYGDQSLSSIPLKCELRRREPVRSYFICAPATLGDIGYRKTIWAWTLTAFSEVNDLHVCQATNEEKYEDMRSLAFADRVPIGLDFKDFSLESLDLIRSVVPRKYTYFRPLSVPFMAFGFKSEKAANSILTAASIVYTIPMMGYGNR